MCSTHIWWGNVSSSCWRWSSNNIDVSVCTVFVCTTSKTSAVAGSPVGTQRLCEVFKAEQRLEHWTSARDSSFKYISSCVTLLSYYLPVWSCEPLVGLLPELSHIKLNLQTNPGNSYCMHSLSHLTCLYLILSSQVSWWSVLLFSFLHGHLVCEDGLLLVDLHVFHSPFMSWWI